MAIYPLIMAGVIISDQITKYLIRANFALGEKLPVLGDWFNITYIRNTGTAFSMFAGNRLVTVVLTLALITLCAVVFIKEVKSGRRALAVCLAFVMSGGAANMIDRLCLGYVTDMISCGSFAVFNIADIAVTCGCFATMLVVLFFYKEDKADE